MSLLLLLPWRVPTMKVKHPAGSGADVGPQRVAWPCRPSLLGGYSPWKGAPEAGEGSPAAGQSQSVQTQSCPVHLAALETIAAGTQAE